MTTSTAWIAALATLLTLLIYEAVLALAQRRDPQRLARSAHAQRGHSLQLGG